MLSSGPLIEKEVTLDATPMWVILGNVHDVELIEVPYTWLRYTWHNG